MSGSRKLPGLPALAALALLVFSTGAIPAGEEHQHEHAKSQAKLVLNQGKKWQIDEVARKSMEAIRGAVAADLKAIHGGKQTDAQYAALAAKLNGEVANMVKNCKLDPKADEQFHVVLTEVLAAAEIMEGKHAGEPRRKGAEQTARALNEYGRYFRHPGWKPL